MLVVNKGDISLTRGDTARLAVSITNNDGQPYAVKESDTLTLTVKADYKDEEVLIEKVVKGNNMIHIEPKDTKELEFGTYLYDVQLTTVDGDNFTVIADKRFKITNEVG